MRRVVVLGGGIAGCAAALALSDRSIDDVLIVEAGSYDSFQIGETIPPDTRLLLERLRLWDGFVDQGHEPCLGSRSAWGADVVGYNDFLLNPHGVGWHLDRQKFGAFMAERAAQSGAEVRSGTRFVAAERGADSALNVLLQTGDRLESVRAQFVVDATGIHSRFAKAMGAKPLPHDRLLWIGGVLDRPVELEPSRLTMIEAVEYGWWYAASVPDGRMIAGAITDAQTNRRMALHRPGRWLLHLEKTRHMTAWLADWRFGNDRLTIRPAPSFVLDRVCGSDWLAVGDAAAAYDPIASQGIHKALSDGLLSAAAIADRLAGIHSAFGGYAASVTAGFADYLNNRNYLYDSERRWLSSTFWQNRVRASGRASLVPVEN